MTLDPAWTAMLRSLPAFDPSKAVAISDLLATGGGITSQSYSADFREAAARRVAGLPPLKKDAKAQVTPRRGLLMARAKCDRWRQSQGLRSRLEVEAAAVNAYWQAQLAKGDDPTTTT